jgi:hypothetical protein
MEDAEDVLPQGRLQVNQKIAADDEVQAGERWIAQ